MQIASWKTFCLSPRPSPPFSCLRMRMTRVPPICVSRLQGLEHTPPGSAMPGYKKFTPQKIPHAKNNCILSTLSTSSLHAKSMLKIVCVISMSYIHGSRTHVCRAVNNYHKCERDFHSDSRLRAPAKQRRFVLIGFPRVFTDKAASASAHMQSPCFCALKGGCAEPCQSGSCWLGTICSIIRGYKNPRCMRRSPATGKRRSRCRP